jgi:serine phosphatase RsbU (regulator of sigma subunit)
MHPAKEVGGDYYDWIPIDEALLICIGDVSGKGVPAGLVMASARSALRSLADKVRSTKDIIVSLNRLLADDLEREMFISLLLMRYEPGSGRLTYTGAGHEHILIWRARERRIETRKTGGMVLGLSPALEEFAKEETIDLAIGDAVILYTDGVTEAVNGANEQYQLERLQASAARHGKENAREMLQAILRDVLAWKGRVSQRDDITLLTIKRTDPSAPEDRDEAATARHSGASTTSGSDVVRSPFASGLGE